MKHTKTIPKKTTKSAKKTQLTKRVVAHHVVKSFVSIAPHEHTGKTLHRRHTSHGVLLIALLFTGLLLFSNIGALQAYGLSDSSSQTITFNVLGHPPQIGATITYPTTNTSTKSPRIEVRGNCDPGTLVVTYDNGNAVGSSTCADDGTFYMTIALVVGTNVLQAQDYDAANQPGPVTPQITINREKVPDVVTPTTPATDITTPETATSPNDITPTPEPIVTPPTPQPSENPCFDTSKNTGFNPATPTIIANCITRSVATDQTITLPIRVSGGVTPYKLTINWGDGSVDIRNVLDTQYHNYLHTYKTAGILNVGLKTTDSKGTSSFLQTVVQVSGTPGATTTTTQTPLATVTSNVAKLWGEAPIPLFWAALTLALGLFVGDIIERIITRDRGKKRGRKQPPINMNRQRHA